MMNRNQKFLLTLMWIVTVVAMVSIVVGRMGREKNADGNTAVVSSNSRQAAGLPALYDAPAFNLINQDGKPFGDKDLRGSVWIADFVFTHCHGPCPDMTKKMLDLQDAIADKNVKLVTFSVDPANDTPAVLKDYAKMISADESRWTFLTGEMDAILAVAAGLHLTALPAKGETPIIHDERFLLIDGDGKVRGIYHSKDTAKMAKLLDDVATLRGEATSSATPGEGKSL